MSKNNNKLNIKDIKKPIQLIGYMIGGMITISAAFLTLAKFISEPLWLRTLIILSSLIIVFVFLYCIFKLITKYRNEMLEDRYYLKSHNKATDKNEYLINPFEKINRKLNRIFEYQIKNNKSNSQIEKYENISEISNEISKEQKEIIADIFKVENLYGKSELFSKRRPLNENAISKIHIEINDLIPDYFRIMEVLNNNGFDIRSTFGSDSEQKNIPKQFTLTFGMNVPIEYIQKLISILKEFGLDSIDFVDFRQEVYDEFLNKVFIGSYSYDDDEIEIVKLTEELFSQIINPKISSAAFYAKLLANVHNPECGW